MGLTPWSIIVDPIVEIVKRIIPDKAAAAAAVSQLELMSASGDLQRELMQLTSITSAQSDIDKVEAASPSVFVAGPRPAIMWVCTAALGYQYLIRPLWTGIALISTHPIPSPGLPGLDENLYQLLWAMLGLGAMRSFDKLKGIDTRAMSFSK